MLKEIVQAQTEGLVKINNHSLQVKEFNGQRVVTFKEIDMIHERVEGTAKRNFNTNSKHFIEKTDFYFVKPADVEGYEIRTSEINNAGTYLITESGYLMLVKSLQDDLAWKVQRELVNNYFRVRENPFESLSPELQSIFMLDNKTQKLEGRLDNIEDTMVIDYGQQEFLNSHARAKVLMALGGKESHAYKRISKVIFSELWRDYKKYFQVNSYKNTPRVQYKEAIEYIANWEPSNNNKLEILHLNSEVI